MAQKNATPTAEQQMTILNAGLKPAEWAVIKALKYSMINRSRETNEVRLIGKLKRPPSERQLQKAA